MSSESEDEFQSADEGSDLEDLDHKSKALAQPSLPCMNVAHHEKVTKVEKDETYSDTGKEEIDKDAENLEAAVNDGKRTIDAHKRTETVKIPKKSFSADVPLTSYDDEDVSVPVSQLCITGHKSVEERALNKPEASKCSEDGITKVCERAAVCVEGQQETGMKQKNIHKETDQPHPKKHSCEVETDIKVQSQEIFTNNDGKTATEELKTKSGNKSEVSSGDASVENTKPESAAHDSGSLAPSSKPKPIKQSKIGMKKPREKLGERLGARKLDAKVALNTTESTSSVDTIRLKEEESENVSALKKKSQVISKDVREDGGEEVEKNRKRQQWEEQQERWHQALNLDRDRQEASLGDDDGWSAPWGGWGNTLLSAATTFTREVGRGVGTVMETVESSIGAPSPEIMAQEVIKQEHERKVLKESTAPQDAGEGKEAEEECSGREEGAVAADKLGEQAGAAYGLGRFSLGSLVSGVSGALETASSKVLLGGLDTLEVIGRKAMDVIQEGDPGLRRKKAFLSNKKPNLSQVLQEARHRAAEEERDGGVDGRSGKNSQKPSFEQAWEVTEGPVHLEALSLVAKQCQSKNVSMAVTLPHYVQDQLHSENTAIKSTCELDEDVQVEKDLAEVVTSVIAQMGLPLSPQKLIDAWSSVQEKAAFFKEVEFEETDKAETELYGALAQLVSQLCTVAHKGGELALITPETDPLGVASHFKELAQAVSGSLENITDQVCGTITSGASAADPRVDDTITNIYLQAASGNNYIQQSLLLLASVLQYSNTKSAAANL